MPVNFPNSPTVGDTFVTNGKTYQWDGEKWTTDTTVTKTDIGLSNVQNYSVANQAEAEAGTLDNLYMTPLKTKQAITEQALKLTFTTTILTSDTWTDQTGYFTLEKTVSGVTADMNPIADLDLSSATVSNVADIQAAYATIYRIETSTDTVTFYATESPSFPENTVVTFEVNK